MGNMYFDGFCRISSLMLKIGCFLHRIAIYCISKCHCNFTVIGIKFVIDKLVLLIQEKDMAIVVPFSVEFY